MIQLKKTFTRFKILLLETIYTLLDINGAINIILFPLDVAIVQ